MVIFEWDRVLFGELHIVVIDDEVQLPPDHPLTQQLRKAES